MSQLLTILTSIVLIAGKSHPPPYYHVLSHPLSGGAAAERRPESHQFCVTTAHQHTKVWEWTGQNTAAMHRGLVKLYVTLITTALTLKLLISLKDRVSVQTTGGAAAVCKPSSVLEVECASLRGLHASVLAACISSQSFCCLLKLASSSH